MKRLFRIFLNVMTGLSLLLLVAAAVAWPWSYRWSLEGRLVVGPQLWMVVSRGGELHLIWDSNYPKPGVTGWTCVLTNSLADKSAMREDWGHLPGIGWHYRVEAYAISKMPLVTSQAPLVTWRVLILRFWLIAIALSFLPVLQVAKWIIRRRIRPGCCSKCGYDLRATPERCPECGQVYLVNAV